MIQPVYCPRCGAIMERRVVDDRDREVCPACVNKRAVMLRLFRFLAPYKTQAILSAEAARNATSR